MARKVKMFSNEHMTGIEKEINKFAETHKIIQISYSISRYADHYCMVLYEDYKDIFVDM
jgi:hypothetical protein